MRYRRCLIERISNRIHIDAHRSAGFEWKSPIKSDCDWLVGWEHIGTTRIFYSCQNSTLSAIDVIYSIGFIVWDTIFISFVSLCLSLPISNTCFAIPSRGIKFYGICQLLHHLFIHSIVHSLAHSSCAQELHSTFFLFLHSQWHVPALFRRTTSGKLQLVNNVLLPAIFI